MARIWSYVSPDTGWRKQALQEAFLVSTNADHAQIPRPTNPGTDAASLLTAKHGNKRRQKHWERRQMFANSIKVNWHKCLNEDYLL